MTMQERVLQLLPFFSGPVTASHIARCLSVKLSSVSSLLKKMTDEGLLERIENTGPRGGYGYSIVRNK